MVKVVKFGGSSLASADQFKKVGNIIRANSKTIDFKWWKYSKRNNEKYNVFK